MRTYDPKHNNWIRRHVQGRVEFWALWVFSSKSKWFILPVILRLGSLRQSWERHSRPCPRCPPPIGLPANLTDPACPALRPFTLFPLQFALLPSPRGRCDPLPAALKAFIFPVRRLFISNFKYQRFFQKLRTKNSLFYGAALHRRSMWNRGPASSFSVDYLQSYVIYLKWATSRVKLLLVNVDTDTCKCHCR